MKLAMETGKQTANEQVKMIEKSKDPNLGKVIDKSVWEGKINRGTSESKTQNTNSWYDRRTSVKDERVSC